MDGREVAPTASRPGGRGRSLTARIGRAVLVSFVATYGIACAADAPEEQAPETTRIVDSLGRDVDVPVHIDRLVSFNSDLTEIIFALGAADDLVAPGYRVSHDQAWLSEAAPELAKLPSPHSPAGINEEELAALDPDLIVSALFGEVDAEQVVDAGERLDIPVVIISFESYDRYFEDIALLAKTLGVEERGEALTARLRQEIARVLERTGDLTPRERVRVYHGVGDVYHTLGKGIFEDDQIRIAGGLNVASDVEGFGVEVSVEQIVTWDPAVIVLLWEAREDAVYDDARLSDVSAVRSRRVFRHPEQGWGFATPRAIFAVTWLGDKLHPDLFADLDMESEADAFYEDVYGFPYSGPPLEEDR